MIVYVDLVLLGVDFLEWVQDNQKQDDNRFKGAKSKYFENSDNLKSIVRK